MAMAKADIAHFIMDQTGFTRNKSLGVTEALLEIFKRTLASGEMSLSVGLASSVSMGRQNAGAGTQPQGW
jgi:hypothetical protein